MQETTMAKTSRATAPTVIDQGPVNVRSADLDGYTLSFVRFGIDIDGAPLLKGLPDDRCACAHWGYVFAGTATFTFADRVETYEAGDAFYTPPGHTPAHSADSEILLISPSADLAVTEAVMQSNMQAFMATQQG
jgi:hypothetical protein